VAAGQDPSYGRKIPRVHGNTDDEFLSMVSKMTENNEK
jgi:hypothetical protein